MSNTIGTASEQLLHFLQNNFLSQSQDQNIQASLAIVDILVSAKCCFRCCLRFLGCTTFQLYTFDHNVLQSALNDISLKNSVQKRYDISTDLICTACLGSIQLAETYVDEVYEKLKEQNYKVDSCSLNCTLPISILTRDHLLKAHIVNTLQEQHKDQPFTADVLRALEDTNVRDPKDFFKYLFGLKLKERTGLELDTDGPLRMTVVIDHKPTSKDHLFMTKLKEPLLKIRTIRQKRARVTAGESRSNVTEALKKLDIEEAKQFTRIPPIPPTEKAKFDSVSLVHVSTYVGGRYLKFSRDYSQTPWAIKGQKLAEHSVSGCIVDILKKYHRADDTKFVSAGREDANVRMLGTGRPFYVELINPRTPQLTEDEYKKIENEINSQPLHMKNVQVRQICYIPAKYTSIIKEGEETKTKQYRALVWLSDPITDELIERVNNYGSTPFTIQQKTPVRVFQRRSAAVRPKVIHTSTIKRLRDDVDLKSPEAHFGVVKLHTQAGTYIKEYVHGDLGRTLPNLASIAHTHSADLLELDVMDVDLIWPPVELAKKALDAKDTPAITNENNKRIFPSAAL
ncbi:hypothetical protein BDF20DRAFT_841383 [Mycotypha africana]|uniref:uncharacterized protein n=1 Tax=Mycotypha africana TaxID=64632 RepID=UPI0023007DF2|nr:uncharacterized protein BDF20DRAFT_841383 [Mycotypha africana]KAI8990896.1 hypothetical protein BDF20DRAFT_841383 [Mycotypha africana]